MKKKQVKNNHFYEISRQNRQALHQSSGLPFYRPHPSCCEEDAGPSWGESTLPCSQAPETRSCVWSTSLTLNMASRGAAQRVTESLGVGACTSFLLDVNITCRMEGEPANPLGESNPAQTSSQPQPPPHPIFPEERQSKLKPTLTLRTKDVSKTCNCCTERKQSQPRALVSVEQCFRIICCLMKHQS